METSKLLHFIPKINAEQAEKTIHEIAVNPINIILTDHAKERMEERDFSISDLLYVLRDGYVDEEPLIDQDKGSYVCKITHKLNSVRHAGVITAIIDKNKKLLIITMEWEFF